MALVEISDLGRTYVSKNKSRTIALQNVNLSIQKGEFICVVGPSGCGKSTLLKILGGLLPASEGMAKIDGKQVVKPRPDVGIVYQAPLLLPWRTVIDNVLLPLEIQKGVGPQDLDHANELLALVGLERFAKSYPSELSGGMQQRVGICRALITRPTLLLMDEPFGALDAMTREFLNLELMRICAESQQTVLFITHSIPESVFLGDRVIVMSSRPGTINDIVPIDLPRPRSTAMMASAAFGNAAEHIRSHFNLSGAAHL
jgi:NitT/TauT family transport system ATP-binding protein